MPLEITIENAHVCVTDGCDISREESCIINDEAGKGDDDQNRRGTRGDADSWLLRINVLHAHAIVKLPPDYQYLQFRFPMTLRCPSCGGIYELTEEDFREGARYYERLKEEGRILD